MGDAWIGIQHARTIGHMHTGLEGSYAGPERWCERCGARLRQRNHGRLCAPCDEAAYVPYVPPPPPTHRCQWCSRAYTPEHPAQLRYCGPTCRNCARKARERQRHERRKHQANNRSTNATTTHIQSGSGHFRGGTPDQPEGQSAA